MSDAVIAVRELSKQYRVGAKEKQADTFFGAIRSVIEAPLRNYRQIRNLTRAEADDETLFWALRDINFEVKQGEVLGIIGHNGAGKSTLLKILSRITDPTIGEVMIKGRISALLEVGTGFHPELTGRENIYMNGTILGMTRREINSKLDEIVDFSGVIKHLDTPVKFYSSGMRVRLGFSVAAHLEPEILIIDEVLSVGDAEFQKKCLGKMKDVSNQGRTVLFVSHNMAAVKQLCSKALVLQGGKVVFTGTELEAVNFYQTDTNSISSFKHAGAIEDAPGNDKIRILSFKVTPSIGDTLSISSGTTFELEFFNATPNINLDVTFELCTNDEITVFHQGVLITERKDSKKGVYKVKGILPRFIINAGIYKFNVIFGESQRYLLFLVRDFVQFEIVNESTGSNSAVLPGLLRLDMPYDVSFSEN